ncbi:MAG: glutamine-hydrolyzing carbamoyl-phosphate synthase small subunit [Capsulimonadales bacterium]|nr:glutamine-hydrolyzing carbamoyl-phosphate synthase small subunit [Capsulimonadales bacterium]
MKATLVLADGAVFEGKAFGAVGETTGEVVFNTGMTGYQEALTDPSYAGQILCLTYPLIGNYGINTGDIESRRVQVSGFVVRELADVHSNWRATQSLDDYLKSAGVVGLRGIDTRALTRRLRHAGVMMGAIGVGEVDTDALAARLRDRAHRYDTIDWVRRVTTPEPYTFGPEEADARFRVSVLDCGIKFNILRELAKLGIRTTVFPATAPAEELLADDPDGLFLSPGPGDPALLGYAVNTVRELVASEKPVMGICLGNQLLGCSMGGTTFKLPFGHRGANHPVKDLPTGRVVITSQNHGYALDADSLPSDMVEVTQINLNDGTVEGLRHRELPVFSIQYHPEASPGPRDSTFYFERFLALMEKRNA